MINNFVKESPDIQFLSELDERTYYGNRVPIKAGLVKKAFEVHPLRLKDIEKFYDVKLSEEEIGRVLDIVKNDNLIISSHEKSVGVTYSISEKHTIPTLQKRILTFAGFQLPGTYNEKVSQYVETQEER